MNTYIQTYENYVRIYILVIQFLKSLKLHTMYWLTKKPFQYFYMVVYWCVENVSMTMNRSCELDQK